MLRTIPRTAVCLRSRNFPFIALVCAAVLLASAPVLARPEPATAATQANPAHATTLQTIVVTGTRLPDRTLADSLAPVDVLTAQDLVATGAPDLDTALAILLPSFNFPQPSLVPNSESTLPAQLRGLSPDDTLVLINGKRQHTTAIINSTTEAGSMMGRATSPVDLNAIPMNAIARIEVLRDGAAAQYGSDAIAGVINIILKQGAQHGSASAGYGQYDGGEGRTWRGGADGGFTLGDRGWVHLAADYVNRNPTNHAGPDGRFPDDPTYDTVTFHYGLGKKIGRKAAVNAQYRLGAHATAYAFTILNQRRAAAGGIFRAPSQYVDTHPAAAAVYPDGYMPMELSDIRDDNTTLGVRGTLARWHYDFSATTGGSHWKSYANHFFNYALGAASPTFFYNGTMTIREDIFNGDFRRDVDVGWAGPLSIAWGVAWRHGRFVIKHGDAASFAGAGQGIRPGDAGSHGRTNAAEYVDLEADPTSRLSLGVAARHERYSDFGNTTTWKVSGRYAFTPAIALRGTVSTGFRAPSLQELYYSHTVVNYIKLDDGTLVPMHVRIFPVSDPAAVALGAQPLRPERSHNLSLGVVFTPSVGPYATLDFYRVDIADRIILSGNLVGPAVQQYLDSVGIPFVSGGNFFTNGVATRTRGADLVVTWPLELGVGDVTLQGGANYNRTSIRSVEPNPPQLGLVGLVLPVIDRQERGRLTVSSPHSKAFVSARWVRGHWRARAQLTRYSEWTVLGPTAISDQTYGARVTLDASVAYTRGRWTWTLGGNNVTNVYPEHEKYINSLAGNGPYPMQSPYGFSGGYYYARVAYRW